MVAFLTKLQIRLTLRSLQRDATKIVGLVILGTFLLFFIGFALIIGLLLFRYAGAETIGVSTTIFFGSVSFLWPFVLILLGYNDMLGPSRFSLYPVRAAELQGGLLIAMVLTLGGIVTMILSGGFVLSWAGSGQTLAISVLAGLVGVVFTALLTRTLLSLTSTVLASRRFRDLAIVLFGVLLMLITFLLQFVSSAASRSSALGAGFFVPAAEVIGWTPFGWAWSLPWACARGAWPAIAAKVVLLAATAIVLWRIWRRQLDLALVSPLVIGAGPAKMKESNFIERIMPQGPIGGIGARTLRHWMRDPRRKMQGVSMLFLPVILSFPLLGAGSGGDRTAVLGIPPITVALVGMTLVLAEICYDGSALAEQILSATKGVEDRIGRVLGISVFLVPFGLLLTIAALIWSGRWEYTLVVVGVLAGVFGVSAGLGAWAGAIWNYPMPPSTKVFATRGNMDSIGGILLASFLEMLIIAPIFGLAVAANWYPVLMWVSPIVSIAIGTLVLWGGIRLGGKYLDNHWPEVLRNITWTRS